MTAADYEIIEQIPSPEVYLALNRAVGWGKVPHEPSIARALQNCLVCFCALRHDKVVGFVRIVGDQSICFYIQDLIVLPEYQHQGIGTRLMEAVMYYIKDHAAAAAFVGLMAAVNAEPFYNRWGFAKRPDERPGMELLLRRNIIEEPSTDVHPRPAVS